MPLSRPPVIVSASTHIEVAGGPKSQAAEGRLNFRSRFACITFDHGYRDNLEYAYPILRHHQVPFAIFVASDFADWRSHLWWSTLESVVSAKNCAAACMSWERDLPVRRRSARHDRRTHRELPRLRKLAPADARREMEANAARIESMLGIRARHFSYPFGGASAAGPREFAYATELGFKTAPTTRPGVLSTGTVST
jgi:peptidoglycan/xylan/chitin deacetylase (PgdA/CDA1 family)